MKVILKAGFGIVIGIGEEGSIAQGIVVKVKLSRVSSTGIGHGKDSTSEIGAEVLS